MSVTLLRAIQCGSSAFSCGRRSGTHMNPASCASRQGPMSREVATSEYPTAPYIENVGVRPDIYYDYMTAENLATGGVPFVRAFTAAIVDTILGR